MTWGNAKKIRKYREGARIDGLAEMIVALNAGRYVFVRGRPYHPAVLRNWSLASLDAVCRHRSARIAELTQEWIDDHAVRCARASEEAADIDSEFAEIGEAV